MYTMKILITGTSSGIGKALAQQLINQHHQVLGISRRKSANNFKSLRIDLSQPGVWEKVARTLKKQQFLPKVIIFNAGINDNDLDPDYDPKVTRQIFEINFFSILDGIKTLSYYLPRNTHFITISSTSAFKGSGLEGVGYASSKAALSVAFESLYHYFKNRFIFTTVYLGPVDSGMRLNRAKTPLILSEQKAVSIIIQAIKNKQPTYYVPNILFLFIRIMKLFPANIYLKIFPILERRYR